MSRFAMRWDEEPNGIVAARKAAIEKLKMRNKNNNPPLPLLELLPSTPSGIDLGHKSLITLKGLR